MATANTIDIDERVKSKHGGLKKRAYEFKLTRVGETACSRTVDCPEAAYEYWNTAIALREWFQETKDLILAAFFRSANVLGASIWLDDTTVERLSVVIFSDRDQAGRWIKANPKGDLNDYLRFTRGGGK